LRDSAGISPDFAAFCATWTTARSGPLYEPSSDTVKTQQMSNHEGIGAACQIVTAGQEAAETPADLVLGPALARR
jgi:hypothetical protein